MKSSHAAVVLFICITVSGCDHQNKKNNLLSDTTKKSNKTVLYLDKDVSMISLIATPEKYEGRQIRIIGYLNLEFEGNGIYLHKDDYEYGIPKNGLWVEMSMDSIQLPQIKKCIKNYVLIEGTFDLGEGHMGAFSGSIKNITRLEVWHRGKVNPPIKKRDFVRFPPLLRKG
jgi:hypothetical protein